MRAVVQRVRQAMVAVDGRTVGQCSTGVLVFLGVGKDDQASDTDWLADKIINLRIFEDDEGKMNRSLLDIRGEMLVVSQFTLFGDCRKGRRPSFAHAAEPEKANELYECFVDRVKESGISVQTGQFRAMMDVSLINDGPVTLIIESPANP